MEALIDFVNKIQKVGKKGIISFLQRNFPNFPISVEMNRSQLIDAVIKMTYPRHITGSASILENEMCDYVKLPFLKKNEIEFLRSDEWIRPATNIIFNEFAVEIELKTKGPKRWQSNALQIGKKKEDQIMFDIKKRVGDLAKQFNPLFKLDEIRYMKSDPYLRRQMPHSDNTEVDTGKDDKDQTHTLVLSSIIAFCDNTSIYITVENKLKKVMIDKGEIIVFKSESTHCGGDNPFSIENERFHCTFHECSRPLKPNQVINSFQCPFCQRFVNTKDKLKSHKMECEMNTSSVAAINRSARKRSRPRKSPISANKKCPQGNVAAGGTKNDGELVNVHEKSINGRNEFETKMMLATVALTDEERVYERINSEIQNQTLTQSGRDKQEN